MINQNLVGGRWDNLQPVLGSPIDEFLQFIQEPNNPIKNNVRKVSDSEFEVFDVRFDDQIIPKVIVPEFDLKFINCDFGNLEFGNQRENKGGRIIMEQCQIEEFIIASVNFSSFGFKNNKLRKFVISQARQKDIEKLKTIRVSEKWILGIQDGESVFLENEIIKKLTVGGQVNLLGLKETQIEHLELRGGSLRDFFIQGSSLQRVHISKFKFLLRFEIKKSKICQINSDLFEEDQKNKFYNFDIDLHSSIFDDPVEERIFFNNAKNYFLAKNDKVVASRIYTNELDSHIRTLKPRGNLTDFADFFSLQLNRIVSDHGTNWGKVLIFFVVINSIFVIGYIFLFNESILVNLETNNLILKFLMMLKPLIFTDFGDYFQKNEDIFRALETIRTIVLTYLYYELIVSLRKLKR